MLKNKVIAPRGFWRGKYPKIWYHRYCRIFSEILYIWNL